MIETLSTKFQARVDLDDLQVSVLRGVEVSGGGLRIFQSGGANPDPMIAIAHFSFHSGITGLFFKPMRVAAVYVSGMQIHIPPREQRAKSPAGKMKGKMSIVVEELICRDSHLVIGTSKPGKDPKDFVLTDIKMRDIGPNSPWAYDANLQNAIPRGQIHAQGTFGPWQNDSPGDSSVDGKYTFDHADLNTIKGIAGILSSVGQFKGQLNRIAVEGTTETPDFALDTANRPIPLHTKFKAIVDGTTGDTYLQPVEAKLRNSEFTAQGAVINVKGKGHIIDLDVDIPAGQMRDFLDLAVKTSPAILTGILSTKSKLHINPGPASVTQKLSVGGHFSLRAMHFTNPQIQDKIDMLSLRAQGDPSEAKPGAPDVKSNIRGVFSLEHGRLTFTDLAYSMPGANVILAGVSSLNGEEFDFRGKVRTDATISQMVASRWKSLLLKPVSAFFKKNGAGAEIPVKLTGTRSEPKFGLAH